MSIPMIGAAPKQMTVENAKAMFRKTVEGWTTFLEKNGVEHGTFRIDSKGLHSLEMAFEAGAHCDAFVALGYEVVSHNVVLMHTPSGGDMTVTSLLVRKLKALS